MIDNCQNLERADRARRRAAFLAVACLELADFLGEQARADVHAAYAVHVPRWEIAGSSPDPVDQICALRDCDLLQLAAAIRDGLRALVPHLRAAASASHDMAFAAIFREAARVVAGSANPVPGMRHLGKNFADYQKGGAR